MPVPEAELPILEALVTTRIRLTHLKKDRTEFVKPEDVLNLYRQVIAQVTRLNHVRDANDESSKEESALTQHTNNTIASTSASSSALPLSSSASSTNTPLGPSTSSSATATNGAAAAQEKERELNRVDTTLADVFQLLSLFFLTIGKSRSAPATYCQLATMMKLLDHLKESGVYTSNDLNPFKTRLAELKSMIMAEVLPYSSDEADGAPHPSSMSPTAADIEGEDPEGRAALTKLLLKKHDRCAARLKELVASLSVISVDLVPLHQKLITLRRQLAALGAKGLKVNKTEFDHIAEELRKIETARVDGKFVVTKGKQREADPEADATVDGDAVVSDEEEETVVPQGQEILSGLLEETFEILQEIHSRDEEVSPQLLPIYERLTEIRKQLEKLTLTHRWTLRETDLYNYQVSLQEIDRMRVDGKFVDAEGNKPHGQRVLLFNLRRCYGLIYRLMSSSEPVAEELIPLANKIATVRRCLNEVLKFGGPFSARDLYPYQLALAQVEAARVDGKFVGQDGTSVPEGQAILNANLSESHEMIQMLQEEMDQD